MDAGQERSRVGRLDEVVVEAGVERAPGVLASGHSRSARSAARLRVAGRWRSAPRDLVAVEQRQPDVEHTTLGREPAAIASACVAVGRGAHLVAVQLEAPRRALGGVVVVVDDQDARGALARRRRRRGRRRCLRRGTSADARQAHRELASPRPPPALNASMRRRASRPAAAPASGRRRGRPARGRAPRLPCANRSKMRGSSSASMPMPWSRTRSPRRRVLDARVAARSRAPSGAVLRRVVQQVGDDLREPREVAVQPQRRRRAARTRSVWPRASMSGCAVSTLCAITALRSTVSRLQHDLALADARDVEQLLDQARQLRAAADP